MSLINKMLQDLDARGSAPGAAAQPSLKTVAQRDNAPTLAVGAAVAVALLLAAGALYWWTQRSGPTIFIGPTVTAPVSSIRQAPPDVIADVPQSSPIIEVTAAPAQEQEDAPAPEPRRKAAVTPRVAPTATVRTVVAAPRPAADAAPRAQPVSEAGRQMTPRQRAESEYNRALSTLQDGRVGDAIAGFERAISIEPRHEAARQTLVGLLVEGGRKGPAMRVLQDGLQLDRRQPAMAMLLARLQIAGGTSGIDTLMRTLPYAQGNGEYHAFLAAALVNDERGREATEQYQAALRTAPGNGVWWMGLGMALQADKRDAEAGVAYDRAIQTASLTPPLRSFVERKIELLSR